MKLRFLGGLILLTASGFAQHLPADSKRFQAHRGMTKQQVIETAASKNPKLLYAELYFIAPQVVDGLVPGQGVFTTEFHVINLDPENSSTFELDFYNQDGTVASLGIVGTGGTVTSMSSISGSLAAG